MNKIITSAGLLAWGATGLQAAYAPGLDRKETSKLLTYSLTTRGFYDDNIATQPASTGLKTDSFGVDLRPSIALNLTSLQQTLLNATYTYGLRWYSDRSPNSADHSHEFNTRLAHQFSERHKVDVDNSFAYAQEPEVVSDLGVVQRSAGNAYRNFFNLDWNSRLTEVMGLNAAYGNSWYDYTDRGIASRSALLDRLEHEGRLAATYQVQPKLVARGGYRISIVDYAGKFALQPGAPTGTIKNQMRHTIFAGADYSLNARVRTSLEAGAQFTDYTELSGQSVVSPYASASLVWVYRQDSYARLGARVDRTATDLVDTAIPGDPTTDAQSIGPYLDVSHKISGRMTAGGTIRYNHYTFNGGGFDGISQNFYSFQLNLDYKLSEFLSATASYNYDRNSSPSAALSGREFDRNRIFLGLTAKY